MFFLVIILWALTPNISSLINPISSLMYKKKCYTFSSKLISPSSYIWYCLKPSGHFYKISCWAINPNFNYLHKVTLLPPPLMVAAAQTPPFSIFFIFLHHLLTLTLHLFHHFLTSIIPTSVSPLIPPTLSDSTSPPSPFLLHVQRCWGSFSGEAVTTDDGTRLHVFQSEFPSIFLPIDSV